MNNTTNQTTNQTTNSKTLKLYQITLDNDKADIIYIGNGTKIFDIIIKENFGLNNDFSLFNCIYEENELYDLIKDKKEIPIIKLHKKINDTIIIFSIVIIIEKNMLNFDEFIKDYIDDFALKFIWTKPITTNLTGDDYFYKIIEKNITKDNLIEILLENVIDLNVMVF